MPYIVDTEDLKSRLLTLTEISANLVMHCRMGKACESEVEDFDRKALRLTLLRRAGAWREMRLLTSEMLNTQFKEYAQ